MRVIATAHKSAAAALRAGGAWPFLGIPLREFTDQVVELDATRFVKRGMTIRDLIRWIVAWSPASYANELGVFDFALVALPNERKTSTNGGTLAPALSMKALVSRDHKFRVQEIPRPALREGELLLQVTACGVCFSDVHKIRFQPLEEPVVLGHEVAGRVVESESAKFHVGDRVVVAHHVPCGRCHYCRHGNVSMCAQFQKTNLDPGGFAEFVRVPAEHVESVAFHIPDALSNNEASFMEPLGCCVRAVKRAAIQPSDVVVVVGLGSIGLLFMQLIRHAGGKCIGLDLDRARRELADSLGSSATFAGSEPDFEESLASMTSGRGTDAVFLTAGNPPLVPTALSWLRAGGTCLVFASLHPDSDVTLDWNQLYYRELNIVTSYSASPADLEEALKLLANGSVRVARMTGHTFPLERFSEALAAIESRAILKAIMTPGEI